GAQEFRRPFPHAPPEVIGTRYWRRRRAFAVHMVGVKDPATHTWSIRPFTFLSHLTWRFSVGVQAWIIPDHSEAAEEKQIGLDREGARQRHLPGKCEEAGTIRRLGDDFITTPEAA